MGTTDKTVLNETSKEGYSRRGFIQTSLKLAAVTGVAGIGFLSGCKEKKEEGKDDNKTPPGQSGQSAQATEKADYTIHIGIGLIEVGPQHIISTTTYNGQFPGPLLRLREGQRTIV